MRVRLGVDDVAALALRDAVLFEGRRAINAANPDAAMGTAATDDEMKEHGL